MLWDNLDVNLQHTLNCMSWKAGTQTDSRICVSGQNALFSTTKHFGLSSITSSYKQYQCSKVHRVSHRIAVIAGSEIRKRKFCHIGICDEGDGLVAVLE